MEVTLDTCEVITLAKEALGTLMSEAELLDAEHLKLLRDYHRQGLITLSVGRTIDLEAMPKDATGPRDIIAEKRIAAAGLNIDRVNLYRSGRTLDIYCRSCNYYLYGQGLATIYAQQIHDIVTGEKNIDFTYYPYRERRKNDPEEKVQKKWDNHKNDTLGQGVGLFNNQHIWTEKGIVIRTSRCYNSSIISDV